MLDTSGSKDHAPKQHYYLGRKNNLGDYSYPNYFSRIGSGGIERVQTSGLKCSRLAEF